MRLLVLLICSIWSLNVFAAPSLQEYLDGRLDPRPQYETLETAHFLIHFPKDLEDLAKHLAPIAENVHTKVTRTLEGEPLEKTNIVIVNHSDETEVLSFVFPHTQIFLDASLPSPSLGMNEFAQWYDWVLTHEYTHIVQLDRRLGFYKILSPIFGSFIRPNEYTPFWLKEGLAVYNETTLTPVGRGENTQYRMMARMAAYENILSDPSFGAPDTIASYTDKNWPWTLRPYFFGYELIKILQKGDNRNLVNLINDISGSFPFQLDSALRASGEDSFSSLWRKTLEQIASDVAKEINSIQKEAETPLEYLTNTGQIYSGLAIDPQGHWLFATRDHPDFENSIVKLNLDEKNFLKPIVEVSRTTGYQTSVSRSGRFIAFDETLKGEYSLMSDIHLYDLKSKTEISMSPHLHVRDADIHPDGQHIVFVQNKEGKNQLLLSDTNWNNIDVLVSDVGYRRISGPRISPSGGKIVFNVHNDETGGEDLWLIDGQSQKVLIENGAHNIQPSWTPAGDILFSSDSTGVFNIYIYDFTSKTIYQLSHVMGGLFYPVVDPQLKFIYVASYRARGYDIAQMAWNKDYRTLPTLNPKEKSETRHSLAVTEPDITTSMKIEDYSYDKYLAPQYMRPSFILRPGSFQVGIDTGSSDPLFFQNYNLNLRYDSATQLPVGEFFYFNGAHETPWDIDVTHDAVPLNTSLGGTYRALRGTISLDLPLESDSTALTLRPGATYSLTGESNSVPNLNQYAGPQVGLRYNTEFKQFGFSFPEYGNFADFTVGEMYGIDSYHSHVSYAALSARKHLPLRWRRNALHFGFDGGTFFVGDINSPNNFFTAGGTLSFPYTLGSAFTLYGYAPNTFTATTLGVANFLYTFPLLDLERGFGTSPFYFGRLSMGLRTQGAAGRDLGGLPWSYGIEIHQDLLTAYVYDMDLSMGLYEGAPEFGGSLQYFLMLTFNDINRSGFKK